MNQPHFDSQQSLARARAKLPLRTLMHALGHAPANDRWKSFACPHCKSKGKTAGVVDRAGFTFFKCHHTACPTGTKALDEIGYLRMVRGLSQRDGFREYLQMAWVWEEGRPKTEDRRPKTAAAGSPPAAETEKGRGGETANPADEFPEEVAGAAGTVAPAVPAETETLPGEPTATPRSSVPPESPVPSIASPPGSTAVEGEALLFTPKEIDNPPPADLDSLADIEFEATEEEMLREFYAQLRLTPEHRQELFTKRALDVDAAAAFGFRSSLPCNADLLRAMTEKHHVEQLARAGLWKRSGDDFRPEPQWCGWGLRGRDDSGRELWDGRVHPIIIPYLNEAGEVFHLRPHKGGISGKGAHLYVPRRLGVKDEEKSEMAVVTEGEFKACVLRWFMGGGHGVAALPGIQQGQNYGVRQELYDWLKRLGAKLVVVVFDNEEKGDPALPGYKEDPEKRYDSVKWARALAKRIATEMHLQTRVGLIPAADRDVNGKADFDGAVSRRVMPGDWEVVSEE